MQDQSQCSYLEIALLAFDFFTSVEAVEVDTARPFFVLFTLCLSMITAVSGAVSLRLLTAFDKENVVDTIQHAGIAPQTEMAFDRAAGRQILWQGSPLTALC